MTTTTTTMVAVPTNCTALCTKLAELAQRKGTSKGPTHR